MNQSGAIRSQERARDAGSLLSIQVLRAIAASAVILPHINREFALKLGLPDALPLETFKVGNVGVDLFFVISGFIMVYVAEPLFGRREAPLNFFLRRCARIIPLYWASSALLLAYVLLHYRDLAAANMSVPAVVASFAFLPYANPDGSVVPINGIGWTLNYEMFFYFVFALSLLASRRAAVLVITILFCALAVASQLFALPQPLAYWADPIILEFVFGMWVALALRKGLGVPIWGTYGLVVVGAGAILGGIFWGFEAVPRVLGRGLPAALIVAGIVLSSASASTALGWRALGFVGDASYALYLTHPMALTLPRLLFPGLIDAAAYPWAYAALLVTVALAAAIVVYVLYEKPATRALQTGIAAVLRGQSRRPPVDGAAGVEHKPA